MTCRTILHPSKRAPASDRPALRGLEIAPRSKSTDVYIVLRVNAAVALYLRALTEEFGGPSSIHDAADLRLRTAIFHDFCKPGVPARRKDLVRRVMNKKDERELLVELLR